MKIITKSEITILESNLNDNTPLFDAQQDYQKGDLVRDNKQIYKAIAQIQAPSALDDSLKWEKIGADNTMACFDFFLNTQSQREENITIAFAPNIGGGLYLGNIEAKTLIVEVFNIRTKEKIEEEEVQLIYRNVKNWKDYFYGEFLRKKHFYYPRKTLTKQVSFRISLFNQNSLVKIGSIFCGIERDFGVSLFGGSVSAQDFSVINTDEEGYTSISKGHYKKLNEFSLLIENEGLDDLINRLIEIRGEPVVFVIANHYECLINFAVLKSFNVPLELKEKSIVSCEIEGLI